MRSFLVLIIAVIPVPLGLLPDLYLPSTSTMKKELSNLAISANSHKPPYKSSSESPPALPLVIPLNLASMKESRSPSMTSWTFPV